MAEYRVPTTEKVGELIQAHADLLEQHGISGGLHASRPAPATDGLYYFSADAGIWSRDNGVSWDEVSGLSEVYIQGLIDGSISSHAGVVDAHHSRYIDAEAAAVADGLITTHASDADIHHTAPTYDSGNKEVVFEI